MQDLLDKTQKIKLNYFFILLKRGKKGNINIGNNTKNPMGWPPIYAGKFFVSKNT